MSTSLYKMHLHIHQRKVFRVRFHTLLKLDDMSTRSFSCVLHENSWSVQLEGKTE